MNISFRTVCLLALTVASAVACKREEPVAVPQPAAVTTPTAAPEANPVDATSVVDNTPAATEAATVDSKAIAGNFSDGESVLELRADGSYVQTLNVGGSAISSDGNWSGAAGGKGLLLDPNSKSAEDVRFDIVSNDELRTDNGTRVFKRVAGK
ncbi:MAG TPA: hypothetical protein VF471_04070 [Pseudoxanthomonas sp.]